jgi:hypothetical protein
LNRQFSKEKEIANKYMKKCSTFCHKGNTNQIYIENQSHPSQNGNHQENKKQEGRRGLVGEIGVAIMEISMEVPLKTKNRTTV